MKLPDTWPQRLMLSRDWALRSLYSQAGVDPLLSLDTQEPINHCGLHRRVKKPDWDPVRFLSKFHCQHRQTKIVSHSYSHIIISSLGRERGISSLWLELN